MKNVNIQQSFDTLVQAQTVAGLFMRQAGKTPEALAVADDRGSVTYDQLAGLAGGIARQIIDKTGNQAARICILAPQNISAVSGMLGVLLSGQCFVPMLPRESDEYLRYLWEDSEASLITCGPDDAKRAASICGDPNLVVVVSDAADQPDVYDTSVTFDPDGISAIMYTSGSTGKPKGVMTTGQAILGRAMQHIDMACVTSSDRQAAVVPWQFSSSIPDVFAPLLTGASLFMYSSDVHGVERLGPFIKKNSITLLKLPAALVCRFVQNALPDSLRSVRYVHCGGGVKVEDAKVLLGVLPGNAVLMHGYASTETNLVAFMEWRLSDPIFSADYFPSLLPAGHPVSGKRIQVVDEEKNPVAFGEDGELVVISRDIFSGYWRQPEMTAGCLKELSGGERGYYTDDLGRICEDGCLEIIGRKGNRVKIRGLRIDLGAVESLLHSLPYVRDAAADCVSFSEREAQLVAYLEVAEGEIVTTTQLREDLKKIAPAYMIPSRFVIVEKLARTENGKIDRKALPAPGRKRPELANSYEPPRTELENLLADIWADVLELDEVGIHDNFLELGGDSLMIVEMGMRLEHEFGDKVKINLLLQASTIARMAQMIETPETRQKEAPGMKVPLRWRLMYFRRRIRRGDVYAPHWMESFLPAYEFFLRFQEFWLSLSFVRYLLREKIAIFDKWLALTGQTDDSGELLLNHLRANTLVLGRNFLITQTSAFDRWISTAGWKYVQRAAASGQGVILVFPHTHLFLSHMRESLILRLFPDSYRLGQTGLARSKAEKTIGLADRFKEACAVLKRGGAVWVAGDGGQGTEKIVLKRFGRRFPFRSGAADLAVQTGAPLIPVFPVLRSDGGVEVEFLPPLIELNQGSRALRSEKLLRQYAEVYVGRWPQMLPNLRAGRQLKRLRDLEESEGL